MNKIVLFDWNGTLLNDIFIFYDSLKRTFAYFGAKPPTLAEYFKEFDGEYMHIYKSRGVAASREQLSEVFGKRYMARVEDAFLRPFVPQTLEILVRQHIRLGLITGQHEDRCRPLLERFDILKYFSYLAFGQINKTEKIKEVVTKRKATPDHCFYIGDAPADIRHAKRAGVMTIALQTTHVPLELIYNERPDFMISRLEEIVNIVSHDYVRN